jgi:hypothetical protein
MRWSKLKHEIESRFCESLKNRLAIHSTAYGNCTCGHAWITLDKIIIANFCTRAFWNTNPTWNEKEQKFIKGTKENVNNRKYKELLNNYGDLSRQDVYETCWKYLHELSIEEALLSDDPLIQTLSLTDKRIGKRRLMKINKENLHPLAKRIFEERINTERISIVNNM